MRNNLKCYANMRLKIHGKSMVFLLKEADTKRRRRRSHK
jgi:hypothetical protein